MIGKGRVRGSLVAASVVLVAACQESPTPPTPVSVEPSLSRAQAAQQAAQAFDRASAEVLALPGTVFADFNEVTGRLEFGVENEAVIPGVQRALERLGLARSTYAIEVTHGIDDQSFITNSHCTATQGGVEGTEYAQPSRTVDPTVIAVEVADPLYFKGGVCPRGKKCRYSDAARALYQNGIASNRGEVARTTGVNNGSLTVDGANPFFTITAQDNSTTNFAVGTVVNKVGRTTGWTRGQVTRTCVNTSVQGSQVMQLCQTFVSDPGGATVVGGGDSGSGVWVDTGNGTARAVGLLWGGSSDNKTFVFSPLASVQQELGAVNATK